MQDKKNKKSTEKMTAKSAQKKVNFLPILTVAVVVVCAIVVFLTKGGGDQTIKNDTVGEIAETDSVASDKKTTENNDVEDKTVESVAIRSGESLVIQKADITTDASFFSVEVDGTKMEIVAVKDSDGNIRTAFNTCQVCYDSGRGYYVQSGNDLVCQNCGNRFSMNQIEIESGGCNPWPIFEENKTVTEDEISISYDFLVDAREIFSNWKENV